MHHIGVTVVAGFLGSGKTTLLRRVVHDRHIGPQVAVIVNELGALGLDAELIRSAASTPAMHVRQLVSGCICCTLRGDLIDALRELSSGKDRPPPRYILIETSGAARASEVSYGVNAISFDAPFRTDAVLTLVDAHSAARAHREQPEIFEDQVRTADVVLLNKGDLVPRKEDRAALLQWVRPLAPRATFLWTDHADLSPALLLGAVRIGEEAGDRGRGHDHEHDDHEGQAGEAHGFTSVALPVPFTLRRDLLEDWLDELADTVFRIKGVVDLQDEDGSVAACLVQAVGDRVELDALPDDSPLCGEARRLIFIGRAPDREALAAGLVRVSVAGG